MICPLFQVALLGKDAILPSPLADCLKEKCAWWDKARSCCVEASKIGAMVTLNSILAEIADKMLHELQFGK